MFGANTENAVRAFQRKYNLSVERIAGANTIKKLESVLKQKSSPGTPSNMNGSAVVPYPGYVISVIQQIDRMSKEFSEH